MGRLTIIKSGVLTSIQDEGRSGYAFYSIPPSGVMDQSSASTANTIVGNPISYPVIESTLIPPTIQFHNTCHIAIAGAESHWSLNGHSITTEKAIKIHPDDILSGSPFSRGLRSYIAISGRIDSQRYLDSQSFSTYLPYKMTEIDQLKKGDQIYWTPTDHTSYDVEIKSTNSNLNEIKIKAGPQYHTLDQQSKQLLKNGLRCTVSNQSNRMGSLLNGTGMYCHPKHLSKSVALIPGMIQLTSSGQMIIILQDGQTTGGYPRIAYMSLDNLYTYNQIGIGQEVLFILE
jgi:antagonist of KipI